MPKLDLSYHLNGILNNCRINVRATCSAQNTFVSFHWTSESYFGLQKGVFKQLNNFTGRSLFKSHRSTEVVSKRTNCEVYSFVILLSTCPAAWGVNSWKKGFMASQLTLLNRCLSGLYLINDICISAWELYCFLNLVWWAVI